ncbi:MAG: PLxRFG domain-containing protein [Ottowia sp.]|nr:PLxRFG domain-containing protein [Ottowia sp.]
MDAVEKALDDGAFHNTDINEHVAKTLGVTTEQRARNSLNVQGGDFGYDVYNARHAVEAQRGNAKSRELAKELNLKPGDVLGTLVFNDGKVTTGVRVVSIKEDGLIVTITGKRGSSTLNGEVGVDNLVAAVDRAKERGKRKDGYAEFVAGRAALQQSAQKPTKKKPIADQTRAKADLMAALADLGDILGKNTRMNIMPEQEQKLLPVLTRVLDAAFRLGYHKFKDAAKFSLDQIRQHLGDEAADALTLDHMQGAYIAMSGGKQGVDTKRAVIDVETKAEIEAHEANTAEPEADTIEAPQDAPLRTSDGAPTAATGRVDRPSQGALGGIPADPVQGTSGGREAGGIAARGRDADQRGNADPDGPGDAVARSVGDGARDVPVPTGGRRSGPVRGRGNASGGRVSGTAPGDDAATATGRPGRLSEPAQPELGGINPAGGPNLAPNAPPIEAPQLTDFTITDDFALGEGGQKTKFKANVAAIRLAKELDANPNRVATQEEQRVLARYVGWGGLAQAFDANNKDWSREHAELRELLNDDEYADAARSTRYAHYTSREVVVDGVYAAMRRFGFTGGKTLEAGAGVGNFLGLMPADMRSAGRFTAIERDRLSSTIARHLYPQQNVQRADFTQFKGADGYFDAAVGNPPFASDTQTDQSGRKHLSGLSLHNYFFAKAVDMLRPGGVMAQVVTSSFLDAKGDAARRYIGERTVFLGAIRLPNNAFSKNAGTEVTTDIIFLQKRPDADIGSKKAKQEAKAWQDTAEFTDASGKKVPLNQYFIDHPNMMLGDFGAHGTMYGPDQPALVARPGQDTAALLREAVQRLPEGVYTPAAAANTASQHKAAMEALKNPAVQEGGYFIDGDRLMRRLPDVAGESFAAPITPETQWTEKQALGESRFDRIRRLAQLRTTLRELIAAEMGSDDARMGALRAQLNEQYDAFQAEHGYISGRSTKLVFEDDPDYPLLLALESDYNPGISVPAAKKAGVKAVKPSAKKAPIFSRRVVAAREAVRKVDTPIDALAVSMAERGRLDAGYIGDLLGRDPQEVLQELASGEKPAIFRDPATDEYVLRDAYLSGNVRAKLAQAIAAGERANVRALEEVQPEDVPASEIVARIGSPWVPKTVYEAFAAHLFGDETAANVRYIKENGSFLVAIKPGNQVAYTATYGTPKMDGGDILAALLNNRPIRVTYRDEEGRTHVDQDATDKANEKAQAIRDKFQDWLFTDGDRAEVLVRAYNDTNNNYVTRVYDGDRMTFPGKVPDEIVKFRRHQRNAIARTVQDRTALYDHVVGAGKTYTVIASAMELRRTGLAKKPMIAVPNHLVKQWAADFYRLYPGANILTATKKDFERENRRKFLAKAATGDWDAIIIAHSSFGFIRSAPDFEEQFNRKEIAKIVAAIEAVESDDDSDKQQKRRTVKQLEGLKERLENRIKALRDRPMDDLLDFDQIGVDQLFVDEFHLFKNLMFSTKMQNVQGLGDPTGSQRAYDMLLKIGQIFAKNGRDQGFVAATGTPVSNSLAEMYHMMRYLMPTQMEALGFTSFDAWANTFASVEQVWMQKPSAEGFKASSRMSTFVNTPELLKMFDQVSDTVTMDNIKAAFSEENDGAEFPLPKLKGGRRTPISLTKTPAQEAYMKELADRAKAVEARKGPPKKGEDNVLVIMSDGRKAAMDMRLVDLDRTERDPGGRVDRASDEIVSRYKQFDGVKGTQLVFSDMGTPISQAKAELKEYAALRERIDAATEDVRTSAALGDEAAMDVLQDADAAQDELDAKGQDWLDSVRAAERGFSVYDDLRKALIEKGVKPEEIAFIHEANTDEQKAALFRKVNSGEIRVLMGSTQKMGAGTNVQERLVALHHLDVPWKPSDVEQREGRIIRQGNRLAYGPEAIPDFEVEILGYVTQDTLDMRMWQIQETKLKMINQLRTRTVAREMENAFEDMEMSAGEMQAAATGNMDLLREIQLRSDVKKLEQRKRAFDASRADLESRRRRNAAALEALPPQIEAARGPAEKVRAYQAKASEALDAFKATIDGKEYDNWREAQEYLRELNDRKVQTTNDKGETVEKAAPLDVTINGERYTARAAMAEAFQSLRGDVEPIIWDVGGKALRTRSEIEKAIRQPVVDAIADKNQQQVGTIAGFDVVVEGSVDAYGNSLEVVLLDGGKEVDSRSTTVQDSTRAHGWVVKSVDGMVRGAGHAVADLEARLKRAQKEAADLAATENTGEWPDTAKLEKARADHKEVLKRLAGEGKPENQPQAAPAANEDDAYMGARRAARQGTPTDRAVMDMLREGREAKDVLRLIAGTSKSRFNRQIARLLIRTGISPTMEALPGAGLGYDKRGFALLAKFNRSSNTVTLTDGAGYMAEQIVLHELIHAATLAALDRKGLHSLQMRRLFEHVRKHGGLAGTYGMKNVGEFTSEAFTNPDFQRELRKIKGVQDGGAIKTAWDGFVRILRSILGLRNDSTDALSQALQIGVAVMREDMQLRQRGVVARGGDMATRNVAGQDSASDDSDAHIGAPTHGYLDGKPHNPPTEQLSAEQRKLIVDTFNANTSGEKVTTTGAVESSGDIGAKSRAFQALAAAEGWTVHRDQIGAKYFNVNKGGRDGINIAVRVSDHSNVNRGIHFKESAINLAPNDGRAAFDDFESALWKLRNAGEDEDGNLTFGGDEPDYFFGAADVRALKDSAMQRVTDTFAAEGTVSLWHKTVGTMRNLAERSPAFKPVFEAAQRFIDDVALMANDAADRAPRVLPRVDTWRDLAKKPISAADNKAIAKPLFEGTLLWARDEQKKPVLVADLQKRYANKTTDEMAHLMLRAGTLDPKVLRMWQGMQKDQFDKIINSRFESTMLKPGVVWSDKELETIFNATPNQISLYRETRAAIDRSIDMTARADMLRALGKDFAGLRDRVLDQDSLGNALEFLIAEIRKRSDAAPDQGDRFMALHNAVVDRATKARDLMDAGYMPLSRFGQYTVDVVGKDGERLFFGMYESKADMNQAKRAMEAEFKDAIVTTGTMSQQDYKLFAGITPESLELFGNMLGLEGDGDKARDAAFQEYLQRAKANQSALKRLIHRQGIAGFSEDVGRVLASFVYSNARLAAGGLNAGTMDRAISNIPKREGELRDVAMGLRDYIKDPQEEGQAIRGMLFAQYLGGSVASAFVNMTQPFAVTIPWLSQYGGIKAAGAQMTRALNDMRRSFTDKGFKYEADLAAALQSAQDDGVVSPQEIHQLMAQARGTGSLRVGDGTRTGDARAATANAWERTKVAWGQPFALAEQFNRRSTFIAAYRTAKERGMRDPAGFARRAVLETQFLYCVDAETECLTLGGWKRRDELVDGDVVIGVDDSGRAVETPLVAVHRFPGPQRVTQFSNGNRFSMVVTAGHRHVVQNYDSRKREWSKPLIRTTSELRGGHQLMRVPAAPIARVNDGDVNFAALLGWIAAEGTYAKFRNCTSKRNVRLVQSSSHNPEYVAEIEALLQRLGGHYRRFETPNNLVLFTLKKPLSTRVLAAMPEKLLTWKMVGEMSEPEMLALLNAFAKGDGHKLREGGWSIGQKQEQNLHVLQAMAVMCGQNATMYPAADRDRGQVAHLYLHTQGARTMVKQLKRAESEVQDGVWCPETGTGTWIARRNGAVFVTGNSKANKPRWARGAVGGTLFTFKTYSVSYLELMNRMWTQGGPEGKRAVGWALASLMLMGGAGGLPFMEDLEDLIDGIAQLMGYNVSTKQQRQRALRAVLGKEFADFMEHGVSGLPGAPVDVSGRLGMGNLLPGTGLMLTKQNRERDLLEVAGPAGDLVARGFTGVRKALTGDFGGAAMEVAPTAVRNLAKGADMAATGIYKDTKGYKVIDTTMLEAAAKAAGFQPRSVAKVQEANSFMMRSRSFYTQTSAEIKAQWAQALFNKDDAALERVRARLAAWNKNNPDQPITVKMPDVWKRVREMSKDRTQRIADTAPKALRQQMRDMAREAD